MICYIILSKISSIAQLVFVLGIIFSLYEKLGWLLDLEGVGRLSQNPDLTYLINCSEMVFIILLISFMLLVLKSWLISV